MTNKVRIDVGYEGTPIGDAMTLTGKPLDVLDVTRHYEQYENDFDLQQGLGIRDLRYSINWGKVWVAADKYDFSFYQPILHSMRARGFNPTLDICHHKTAHQIVNGFANQFFPELLTQYAVATKKAFPWVKRFVLINEPAVTAFFHSTASGNNGKGIWGNHEWHRVYLNMAKAIVKASHELLAIDPEIEFYIPEPIDHDLVINRHDTKAQKWVDFLTNWGRFGMDELLAGKVDMHHGMYHRLLHEGASEEDIAWFQKNRAVPYFRDLDFYQHCFKVHYTDKRDGTVKSMTNPNPPTLVEVVAEYRSRFPEMRFCIAETNLRGTIRDRITWFRWVVEQCIEARISRMTWWGLTDADTWGAGNFTNHLNLKGEFLDPVGIYGLGNHSRRGRLWVREHTEFADIVRSYAKGEIDVSDIPAYEFTGEYQKELAGYRKHMHHMSFQSTTAVTTVG